MNEFIYILHISHSVDAYFIHYSKTLFAHSKLEKNEVCQCDRDSVWMVEWVRETRAPVCEPRVRQNNRTTRTSNKTEAVAASAAPHEGKDRHAKRLEIKPIGQQQAATTGD